MKNYELSVLIHPDLEANLETALTKVRRMVTDAGGTILNEDLQGKKKTAYRIKGQDFAIYVYMDVSLPAEAPLRISNTFNITDKVLRYLLVITDEKGRQALAEAKESGRSEDAGEEDSSMAKGFSKVILMGNLTRDVEMRTTPSGQNVASFSLAISRSWRGQDGQQQEQTSFINCVAWGKAGEIIAQYTSKGSSLLVSGRLDQRSYDDKDGNKRQAVEVVVEDFNFTGSRGDNAGSGSSNSSSSNTTAPSSNKSNDVVIEDINNKPIDLSEIPF